MGIEDLFEDIRALPPGQQAEVIDLVHYLRGRSDEEARLEASGHTSIDAIMADPAQRAALLDSVCEGLDEHARGESLDMDAAFGELASGLPE